MDLGRRSDVSTPMCFQWWSVHGPIRGLRLRANTVVIIVLTMLVFTALPTATASSEISFTGVSTLPEADGSASVAIDGDAKYLASGYDDHLAVMSLPNMTLLDVVDIARPVQTLEFSPDGSTIAIATSGSELDTDSIRIYDMESMTMTGKVQAANARPVDIAWSPDGDFLAVPNSDNGVNLIRVEDMGIERSLTGEHNTDVTCVSFSPNGGHLLTGDASGRVVMWNFDGTPTTKKWELVNELTSCEFDPMETRIATLTVEGDLNTMSFAGGSLLNAKFELGGSMEWSSLGNYLHLIVPGTSPMVISVSSTTFGIVETTKMAHEVKDMAFVDNLYGMITQLYVATNSLHIASYGLHQLEDGFGVAGADLDGDGVPDTHDDDDDGDATSDQWDNNCQDGVEDCSRSPDPDNIRSVNMRFNDTHVIIVDRVKLDSVLSSSIRNMSRTSLIQDLQLSPSEADLFAQSVCSNLNEVRFIEEWIDNIVLSEGQLSGGEVVCRVTDGMTFKARNDYLSMISLEFEVTFNRSSSLSYPLVVTLEEQPGPTDASLAHLVEMHPINIELLGEGADSVQLSPWWVTESPLVLTLEEETVVELTLTEKGVQLFADYPILFLPIIGLVCLASIAVLRAKNNRGMDLDIFDDEQNDAKPTQKQHDQANESEATTSEDESMVDDDPERETSEDHQPTTRSRIPGRDESTTSTPPPSRRTRVSTESKEGPITTVKRKRLDGSDDENVPKKRAAVKKKVTASETPVRKTRRVVTQSDNAEDESPSEG